MTDDAEMALQELFEVWVDTALKAQVVAFFDSNPGAIETVPGLARRLGTSPEALRHEIKDHLRLGLLREHQVGTQQVLVYDQGRRQKIERFIQETLRRQEEDL